ncbi:MAG: glycosyltransferase family 2 protein [Vampirovibrionales bacterium]|nr:glycosyltransferase family 2 protein [Vampirovibrionales bacterium]
MNFVTTEGRSAPQHNYSSSSPVSSLTQQLPAVPSDQPLVSFIVPVYNEADNVDAMVGEIMAAGVDVSNFLGDAAFELVVVDDGSTDETVAHLNMLVERLPNLSVVCLKRNYGQTAATAAGFAQARGQIFVTLDGDLQNDPADARRLIELLLRDDLDIVCGWRKNRQDKAMTRVLPSKIANWIIGKSTGVQLHDYGCSLKVYRAEVAKSVPLYGEMHRFIPALASQDGARICEVPVNHRPRTRGVSKYNLSRTFKVILDLMTVVFFKRFVTRPLHMFGRLGMILMGLGLLGAVYLTVDKFILGHNIGGRPLLMFSALMILSGVQLISTGLLAEVSVRTYFESQQKPIYSIRRVLRPQ